MSNIYYDANGVAHNLSPSVVEAPSKQEEPLIQLPDPVLPIPLKPINNSGPSWIIIGGVLAGLFLLTSPKTKILKQMTDAVATVTQ